MAIITEDYVSFETAKLLKDKGFIENCLMRYNKVGDLVEETNKFNWNFQTIDYSAPTLQIAMKWLREVHKIDVAIFPQRNGYVFALYNNSSALTLKEMKEYSAYEQACEAAIKYCLKNLI